MTCYHPLEWLVGEDAGGTVTLLEVPDNSLLTQSDIDNDVDPSDPCIEPDDCGIYRFEYRVDCADCEDLYDVDTIVWDVPCLVCDDCVMEVLTINTGISEALCEPLLTYTGCSNNSTYEIRDSGGALVDSGTTPSSDTGFSGIPSGTGYTITLFGDSGCPDVTDTFDRCDIGNYTWDDTDGQFVSVQDVQDVPLPGVFVELISVNQLTVFDSTTSDSNGMYCFTDVASGDYRLRFTTPSGYTLVQSNVGFELGDSDPFQGSNNITQVYTYTVDDCLYWVDGGYRDISQ